MSTTTAGRFFRYGATALALTMLGWGDGWSQAVVKGRVVSEQVRHALPGVEVILEDLQRSTVTNDSGYFRLANIPLGLHRLRFRRIGFLSAVAPLRIEAADSVTVEVPMEAFVPELEPIIVTALPVTTARLDEVGQRMRAGTGKYIPPKVLRTREQSRLSDLLREKGVMIGRGTFMEEYAMGRNGQGQCLMHVLVDGLDMTAFGADLSYYRVDRLEAVEVYKRAESAPVEFSGVAFGECGLLLLWTRP